MRQQFRHVDDDLRLYLRMMMVRHQYFRHLDFLQCLDDMESRLFRLRHNVGHLLLVRHLGEVRHLGALQNQDELNLVDPSVGDHLVLDAHQAGADAALVDVVQVDAELVRYLM